MCVGDHQGVRCLVEDLSYLKTRCLIDGYEDNAGDVLLGVRGEGGRGYVDVKYKARLLPQPRQF